MTNKKGKMKSEQEIQERIEQWMNFSLFRFGNFSANQVVTLVVGELEFISGKGNYDVLKLMKEEMECRQRGKV